MAPDTKPRSGDKDNNFYANLERLRKKGLIFATCPYGKYIFRENRGRRPVLVTSSFAERVIFLILNKIQSQKNTRFVASARGGLLPAPLRGTQRARRCAAPSARAAARHPARAPLRGTQRACRCAAPTSARAAARHPARAPPRRCLSARRSVHARDTARATAVLAARVLTAIHARLLAPCAIARDVAPACEG